ncbi:hypothetical protein BKA70DRAFT_1441447 [Coprinopsis sp. MPI-PUGE-AT-0042]|nr:hypothetical protein BKA70DRAFT_1441447 [Coprinopsis sp. MPI-PUGE-AT-0042]
MGMRRLSASLLGPPPITVYPVLSARNHMLCAHSVRHHPSLASPLPTTASTVPTRTRKSFVHPLPVPRQVSTTVLRGDKEAAQEIPESATKAK